jgi:hypothetical protein
MSFNISASEAVLLGRALEEYLQAKRDSDGNYFLDFLWNRIGCFSPPIACERRDRLEPGEVPVDIKWDAIEGGRVGFAPSWPSSYFLSINTCESVTRFTRDRSARSLTDHVAGLVWSQVARGIADESRFNVEIGMAWGQAQVRHWTTDSSAEDKLHQGEDDPASIETAISALVDHSSNNRGEHFRIGRTVGRVLAECQRYEAYLLGEQLDEDNHDGFQAIGPRAWRDRLLEALPGLVDSLPLQSFSHAGTWFRKLNGALYLCHDPDECEIYWLYEYGQLAQFRAAVWLALGEILRASRSADDQQILKQPAIPIPRMLRLIKLTPASSPDKIRGALQGCETMFDEQDASVYPELIVVALSSGIEALAKRVWPNEFLVTGGKGGLGKVLADHTRSGSDREVRFASLAQTLYKNYRHPAQHELDAFRCTWSEAAFFFYGMQTLLQLSEEICQRRPGGGSQ